MQPKNKKTNTSVTASNIHRLRNYGFKNQYCIK